jgi:hypothetical protein
LALLAGCTRSATKDFVQGDIRLTPPIKERNLACLEDGGSICGRIKDAKGRTYDIFIDYRLRTKTPGAVYFNGEPGEPKSVRVTNGPAIMRMLGLQ